MSHSYIVLSALFLIGASGFGLSLGREYFRHDWAPVCWSALAGVVMCSAGAAYFAYVYAGQLELFGRHKPTVAAAFVVAAGAIALATYAASLSFRRTKRLHNEKTRGGDRRLRSVP